MPALCVPFPVQPPAVTVTFRVVVPVGPAVKTMLSVFVALVMVPFVIDHAYVAPPWTGTLAVFPVEPAHTLAGAEIVATGSVVMVTVCVPVFTQPAPSV